MYSQWKRQGKPRTKSGFTWTHPTGTGFVFSSPVWSGEHLWHFVSEVEPFGFVAGHSLGCGLSTLAVPDVIDARDV